MPGKHRADAKRQPARVVETSDYVAFMTRVMIGWGDRVASDPAALVHLRELELTLTQQTNRGVWEANERGQYSQNHMAAILGVSRQAVAKRIGLGQMAAAAIAQARGAGALVRLGEVRARRARLLKAADVPDLTGSERERMLRAV
jgi:hypothetical protein